MEGQLGCHKRHSERKEGQPYKNFPRFGAVTRQFANGSGYYHSESPHSGKEQSPKFLPTRLVSHCSAALGPRWA